MRQNKILRETNQSGPHSVTIFKVFLACHWMMPGASVTVSCLQCICQSLADGHGQSSRSRVHSARGGAVLDGGEKAVWCRCIAKWRRCERTMCQLVLDDDRTHSADDADGEGHTVGSSQASAEEEPRVVSAAPVCDPPALC